MMGLSDQMDDFKFCTLSILSATYRVAVEALVMQKLRC